MTEYSVAWEIEVDADGPGEAAERARRYQLDPGAWVGHFTVRNCETGKTVDVDLTPDKPEQEARTQ